MNDPKHPVWSLLRLVVLGLILSPVVYANCNSFDADEIREIIIVLTLASFGEAGWQMLARKYITQ